MNTEEIIRRIGEIADELKLEAYVVGGYVRDKLLGKTCKDIDFVIVGSGPEFAKSVKKKLNARALVIYERFGTAMLDYRQHKLEFVGARKERYNTNSRKPEVSEGRLEDDLARRDFTINAMAFSINAHSWQQIMDPFNGRGDLEKRILRTPDDPVITFEEDPLRIMRAIRFATQLDFKIEEKTKEALGEMRDRLRIISQERITEELRKILLTKQPSIGFKLMDETGVLDIVLPQIAKLKGVEEINGYYHKDVFLHTLKVVDNVATVSDNFALRFTALFHDVAKPTTKQFKDDTGWTFHGHDEIGARMMKKICRQLRLPNELCTYTEKLIRLHMRPIQVADEGVTDSAIRRLLVQAGEEVDDLLTFCRADITSGNPERVKNHLQNFDRVVKRMHEVEEKDRMRQFQSPVRGDVIMQVCNIAAGPAVGKLKSMIEEAILDGTIPNEYDAAYDYLLKIKDTVLESLKP